MGEREGDLSDLKEIRGYFPVCNTKAEFAQSLSMFTGLLTSGKSAPNQLEFRACLWVRWWMFHHEDPLKQDLGGGVSEVDGFSLINFDPTFSA